MPTWHWLDGLSKVLYAATMTKAKKKKNRYNYKGKSSQTPYHLENRKPIDLWLGLSGTAIGITTFLLPDRSSATVVIACVLIFALLVHPVWNFWWIERSIARQVCGFVVLLAVITGLGLTVSYTHLRAHET